MKNTDKKKYFAFISYSHKDSEMAKWLQHEFEYYELPAILFKERKDLRKEDLPESFRPVFRDEDELAGGELKPQISKALADSEYLFVICSPNSAQSVYVESEIREFISLSPTNKRRIFPFIVDGKPHQDEEQKEKECFPKTLLELSKDKSDPIELIAGDIHATGRDHAFVQILAGTLKEKDVQFSDLWDRYAIEKAEKERKEREDKEKLQIAQSRFVAEKAKQLIEDGDSYLAKRLLVAIHEEQDRPYVAEIEAALRKVHTYNSAILKDHLGEVYSVRYSHDFERLVSTSFDKTIRLWNVCTGKCILEIPISQYVTSVFFTPDDKYIMSGDGRLWDSFTGKEIDYLKNRYCFTISSDREYLVDLFDRQYPPVLEIRDKNTYKLIHSIELKGIGNDGISLISFSGKNGVIAGVSKDSLVIWDYSGKRVDMFADNLNGHSGKINSIELSADGKKLLSASGDCTLRVFDIEKGDSKLFEGHKRHAISASFINNDTQIISASYDNTIKIWDEASTKCLKTLEGHTDIVSCIDYCSRSHRIISSSRDNTIRIWDSSPSKKMECLIRIGGNVNPFSFNPNKNLLETALVYGNKDICLLDLQSKKQKIGRDGHNEMVCSVVFSQEGNMLASTSYDGTICIWDAMSVTPKKYMHGHTSTVTFAVFGCNDRLLASSSCDGTIRIWNVETEEEQIPPLIGHTSAVDWVSFSHDGKKIVSSSRDRTVRVWDVSSGRCLHVLNKHILDVTSSMFSNDDKLIISSSMDKTIRIWSAETGECIRVIEGHTDGVYGAALSPEIHDGYIASVSRDKTLRVWHIDSGVCIFCTDTGYGYGLDHAESVSFSPDGEKIFTGRNNGPIKEYDFLSIPKLINNTRERFKDNPLTPEERRKYYLE